ncbi:MAG TPA: ROK family transcriptional regulator [Bryobacteraceae bacterium]|nr:ROK family transcriptional regulator [Bryobacteraceae bacterium]
MTDSKRIDTASPEVVRQINRRVVLNLIRTRQPISRADLARLSGMQRSTISLIVEELLAENWLIEGDTVRLPRGRRPTFLRLNDDRAVIGVDIRPSQITIALADVNGQFLSQEILPTPATSRAAAEQIATRIQRIVSLWPGKTIEGIGVSLPGRVHPASGKLMFAPNLRWAGDDLRALLTAATGIPVETENAANACVLASLWFDQSPQPAETLRDFVVVTVSEGIGCGILVNGRLARGVNGMAGEFGHVPLNPDGPKCGCGNNGCWEVYGSNRAALRYYTEANPQSGTLTFQDLLRLADQGDAHAVAALDKMAHYLGQGMRLIVTALAPERIVVIGDLTRSWARFGPAIEAEVNARVLPGTQPPPVVPAHQDGLARLRGTVALVLQKHFSAETGC